MDINRRTLTLYDSMMANESYNVEVRKYVEPLVQFLPHLLDNMSVFKGDQELRREVTHLSSKFFMNSLNKLMDKYTFELIL